MPVANPLNSPLEKGCTCPLGPNLGYVTQKDGEALIVCLGCHAVYVVKTTVTPTVNWP